MCISATILALDRTRVSYTSVRARTRYRRDYTVGDSFPLRTVDGIFLQRPSDCRTGVDMLPCSGRVFEPHIMSVHPFLIAREVVNPKKLHVSSLVVNDAIFMRSSFVYADLCYVAVYDVVGCRSCTLVKTAEGA